MRGTARGVISCCVAAAAALTLAAAGPGAQAQPPEPTSWLCHPGQSPNPCVGDLTTTYFESDGSSTVKQVANAANPKVDCFYVYPTVSDQPTTNANKNPDPPIATMAKYQAQRFSQNCRVYAPLYRQRTVAAIFNPTTDTQQALQIAYTDVLAAWRDYLRSDNDGRGVILIGHSQGTAMLRRLIREEIDPSASARRRLVSAVLPGGNVLVKKGSGLGGDFQHVPACTAARQPGCVLAWSTFNRTPPSNTRFGRYTPPPGEPDDKEVLCTNPGSLADNSPAPLRTLQPSERFPAGFIALGFMQLYNGMQPTAPTPWLQPADHFTARCVREAGTNTLRLTAVGKARQPTPSPDATWGLHLADMNFPLGDLIAITRSQASAYLAAQKRRKRASCLTRGGTARGARLGRVRLGGRRVKARSQLTGAAPAAGPGSTPTACAGAAA